MLCCFCILSLQNFLGSATPTTYNRQAVTRLQIHQQRLASGRPYVQFVLYLDGHQALVQRNYQQYCNNVFYTVSQKTCDYVFDDKLNQIVRSQQILVHLFPRVYAIDRCFYFPTSTILCNQFTVEQRQDLNISKKIKQNNEDFTGKCDSD